MGARKDLGAALLSVFDSVDSELHTPKMYFSNFMIHFSLIVVFLQVFIGTFHIMKM